MTENLSDFDIPFKIDGNVVRTDIRMGYFILLQVLHNAKESLSKIPELTFLVR